jgi:hypothetical protein
VRIPLLMFIAAVGLVAFEQADGRAAAQQASAAAAESSSSSPASSAAGQRPEVIIKGQRELATRISAFVNQLTDFDISDPARGMARWQERVCPLVSGLPRQQGEYILTRVSEIAQAAGAPLGGRWCRPNLFILVSEHPQEDLQDLEKRHRSEVFGGALPNLIEQFIAAPRPVRTWYDTVEKTADGLPMVEMSYPGISTQNAANIPYRGEVTYPVGQSGDEAPNFTSNPWSQASHLTLNVVWAIYRAFVIVDPTRFKGVSLGQLADYVAMSGLAQVALNARLGDAPSILTLFDEVPQAANAGLTDWDRAFLKAVYSSEQKSILQRSEIARGMVRAMSP